MHSGKITRLQSSPDAGPTDVRALFLVLLLGNILFFAWTRWLAPPPDVGGHPTPTSQDRRAIQLLRELSPSERQFADAQAVGLSAGPGPAATCVSGGPYLERAAAEQAAARLTRLGFTSRLRPSRDEIRVGQWVRIENLATPEDAQNALAAVRAAGVADAYVLTDEPPGNVVSLGVFGDTKRAAEVVAMARRAGFAPTADDRRRVEDVYWVDVDRDANASLPGIEAFQAAAPQEVPLELRACPTAESVTPGAPTP